MSVEVEGLYGNGPGGKLKIFSMMDGTGDLLREQVSAPTFSTGAAWTATRTTAISFKALFGDEDLKFEPDFGQRAASVMSLDRDATYFWKATWSNEVPAGDPGWPGWSDDL